MYPVFNSPALAGATATAVRPFYRLSESGRPCGRRQRVIRALSLIAAIGVASPLGARGLSAQDPVDARHCSQLGVALDVPAAFAKGNAAEDWAYSPDGSRLAACVEGAMLCLDLSTGEVCTVASSHATEGVWSTYSGILWGDNRRVLTWETRVDIPSFDAERRAGGHPIASDGGWVLFDVESGERTPRPAHYSRVAGLLDVDRWFILSDAGELHLVDAAADVVLATGLASVPAGCDVRQTAPGSPWFILAMSGMSTSPGTTEPGTVQILNVTTGEMRGPVRWTVGLPFVVTPDARYAIGASVYQEGALQSPILFDLVNQSSRALSSSERWNPCLVSSTRGVLLASIYEPVLGTMACSERYVEIQLSDVSHE